MRGESAPSAEFPSIPPRPYACARQEGPIDRPDHIRYDAIVVGARCAGAATALLLARHGLRVLLFDRDRHGADTLSTLALMRIGVLQLQRWGILESLRAEGVPEIRKVTFLYGDEEITFPIKPRDGVEALYAPRRTLLDRILVDAAAHSGAEVLFGARLVSLTRDDSGRVNGLELETRDRTRHRLEAGIVIGADGIHSAVARAVDAPTERQGKHACTVVYSFWRGLENRGYRWYFRPEGNAGAIPTNGDVTCIFAAVPSSRFESVFHRDLEGGYRRQLEISARDLAPMLRDARPSEPVRGFPGLRGYLRRSHGPGWALVGDAGYFKDPITAHGISDALRDAELLARAVLAGTDDALAAYPRMRDELSTRLFEITDEIAGFEWTLESLPPLHVELSRTMNHEVDALLRLEPIEPGSGPNSAIREGERRTHG